MSDYKAAGKTIFEIEEEMKAVLKDVETEDPEISVGVTPRLELVHLHGQFNTLRAVPVELLPDMTLRDAIARAGGFRITADSDYALLRRPYGNPSNPTRFHIDLNDTSEEIFLFPEDEIYLQRNFLASVIAYLREYVFGIIPSAAYSAALGASI